MSAATKEYHLIFVDVVNKNSNKVWEGYLYDDGSCETRWGRVGAELQSKKFPGRGESFLEKKYHEKIAKGYTPLKTIKTGETKVSTVNNLSDVAKSQIKFSNPVLEDLINRLVKYNIHNITSSTSINYDVKSGLFTTPLGIVTQECITEARDLLFDIKELVTKSDYKSAKAAKTFNLYLRLIPSDIGMKADIQRIFPDDNAIQKQSGILDSLEVSLQSALAPTETKKTEKVEKVFDLELDYVDKGSAEFKRLNHYYTSTNRAAHGYTSIVVDNIYKVRIGHNHDSFQEKIGNLVEVFHGSGAGNILSILKSGLRVTPPKGAAIAGAMFGAGLYGATDSSKSLQYTAGRFTGSGGERLFLFICDFAMGNAYEIKSYGGHRPAGYDSIYARARNTGLRFDELIVPKETQVKIKYLIELKK
jgi:poly [ADP-ribose] polymerase